LVLRSDEVMPESARFVVVAFVVTLFVAKKLVEVALVVVPLITERFAMVEDAAMLIPRDVVGVSAPDTTDQSLNDALMKSTPGTAATTLLEPSVLRSDEVRPARFKTPLDENDEVAVPPKEARYAESCVDDARVNCWSAVQVFAFPVLSEAITAPVVGEMVRVPSRLVTDVTPPCPRQEPDASRKQPPVSWIPFANVEVAEVEMTSSAATRRPLEKVEVPAAETLRFPVTARFVVVALVRTPLVALRLVEVELVVMPLVAKKLVEVAFVVVASVMVTA
jgi:hypothetical protein